MGSNEISQKLLLIPIEDEMRPGHFPHRQLTQNKSHYNRNKGQYFHSAHHSCNIHKKS